MTFTHAKILLVFFDQKPKSALYSFSQSWSHFVARRLSFNNGNTRADYSEICMRVISIHFL